jgi:quinol monooxygenase YgiN
MPFVNVKLIKGVFSTAQKQEIISKLTDTRSALKARRYDTSRGWSSTRSKAGAGELEARVSPPRRSKPSPQEAPHHDVNPPASQEECYTYTDIFDDDVRVATHAENMKQLQVSATFPSISPGAADQFKQLAAEALATIRGEPGTLQHDWFFSNDGDRCVVRETYASSDAFLAHLAGAGPLLGQLVELGGGLELEVFGEPSAALRDAIAAFRPRIYRYSQGK